MISSKIFCTFVGEDMLDATCLLITRNYTVLYKKLFVLYAPELGKYILTYNLDPVNIREFPENTILVHRKKEFNTLYTINALNTLIRSLNNGVLDKRFPVDWNNYRNSLLMTKGVEFVKVGTKLIEIRQL